MAGFRVALRSVKIATHVAVYLVSAFLLVRLGQGFIDGLFGG